MKKTMKKWAVLLAVIGMADSIIMECGASATGSGAQNKEEKSGNEPGSAGAAEGTIYVGIIFTEAGLGGDSLNDLALEGVKQAAEDFGITYDGVEPKSVSDEEIIQDEMAASGDCDLIICVGAEQADTLTNAANTYPEQRFALLDATSSLSNAASYSCKEQEGAFLAGALAALAKQEKIDGKLGDSKAIGFIDGVDNPPISHFAAGYQAGAQYIEPGMKVLIDYAGGFNDPTTAKTIANTFVEKDADVIFHAVGASRMGMFQTAEEKGFVAIGVNPNQNGIVPDYVMASMLKKPDSCAYHVVASAVEGAYTGENQMLGLSDGGVDVTVEQSNIQITDQILEQLEELRQKAIAGEIQVPSELD